MFKFKTEQKVYEVGRIKIGGQPGELPTVLVGSIFWLGQKMVKDANQGIFDAKEAENLINKIENLSDITGVPFVLVPGRRVGPVRCGSRPGARSWVVSH